MTSIDYKISKDLFEKVMGFNVCYIELVGRKNSKRIKYFFDVIDFKTIDYNEFLEKLENYKKDSNEN